MEEQAPPTIATTEFQSLKRCHCEEAHQIVASYEVVDNDPALIAAEISRLQGELASTDYKITKAYEYALLGAPPPYDPTELHTLHTTRQSLRDKINELAIK